MKKRIKHNDLLPWFTEDHGQLPASYLKSTQKFFDGLQVTSYKLPGQRSISNANKGLIHKRQARVGPPHNVQGHKKNNKK
jgi:hypothetical protein